MLIKKAAPCQARCIWDLVNSPELGFPCTERGGLEFFRKNIHLCRRKSDVCQRWPQWKEAGQPWELFLLFFDAQPQVNDLPYWVYTMYTWYTGTLYTMCTHVILLKWDLSISGKGFSGVFLDLVFLDLFEFIPKTKSQQRVLLYSCNN